MALVVIGLVITLAIVGARSATGGNGSGMGTRSHSFDAGVVSVAGIQLQYHHCQSNTFSRRLAKLNTTGMTMLGLDWANKDATCFVCENCGHVHWFVL